MNLILQKVSRKKSIPPNKSFNLWIETVLNVLTLKQRSFALTVRIVDEKESAYLNNYYRKKNQPTNVLSFKFDLIPLPHGVQHQAEEVMPIYECRGNPCGCPKGAWAGQASTKAEELLGDIVICAPVAIQEAKEQHKTIEAHFAHLTIHGMLHLLGYDHEKARDAKKMEGLEVAILHNLGYKNPYL